MWLRKAFEPEVLNSKGRDSTAQAFNNMTQVQVVRAFVLPANE
jgi:hypothetical protein